MSNELIKPEISRNEKGQFPPGVSGHPEGRPKGSRNFTTLFRDAIKQIAEANNMDDVQVEMDLLKMAIKMAREGNFNYYKDIMDRNYGQARQKIDMGLDDEIAQIEVKIVKGESNHHDQENASQGQNGA